VVVCEACESGIGVSLCAGLEPRIRGLEDQAEVLQRVVAERQALSEQWREQLRTVEARVQVCDSQLRLQRRERLQEVEGREEELRRRETDLGRREADFYALQMLVHKAMVWYRQMQASTPDLPPLPQHFRVMSTETPPQGGGAPRRLRE
jgi:TolA-binding protein